MLAVGHLDFQFLLQRQFEKSDSFVDQYILNSGGHRCILDVEEADVDYCSSEAFQEFRLCCRVIGKSEVQQRNLIKCCWIFRL